MAKQGYVYILASSFKRLYIGVTTDLEARIWQHKNHHFPDSFTARYKIDSLVYYESYGLGWLEWGSLLIAAIASPLLCANALMSGQSLPTFLQSIGPRDGRTPPLPTMLLGGVLAVTTLIAAQTALGFVFDGRWRDFPFAGLTMAAVPLWTLTLNRPKSGTRPLAEAVFAALFLGAALYTGFNEGSRNWQALWTSAAYLLLGITLWQARSRAAARTISNIPTTAPDADPVVRERARMFAVSE